MTMRDLGFVFATPPVSARTIAALALSLFASKASPALAQPRIGHDDVSCVSRGEFTQFLATFDPPADVRSAKIYFRSALYPEFYFVEMSLDPKSGTFRAVLPLPSPETTRILYYFEAIDVSFQTARSAESEATVSDGCRPGPGGRVFPGGDPGIVVGAVQAGAAALPAGFQATGIAGFLSAAGGVSGAAGGLGVPVALGAAAAAAAGIGVVVAAGGESGGAPASPTNTTSTLSGSVPGNPPPSSTTTSTTTTTGPSTSTTTAPPGSPPPSTTSSVSPQLTSCFAWQALRSCKVFFQSCSTPEGVIRRFEWRMLGPPGPEPPSTPSFTYSFDADPRCANSKEFNRPVRLTVYDASGGSATLQENVLVRGSSSFRGESSSSRRVSFESEIVALPADGSVRGQVLLNGSPLPLQDNSSPVGYEAGMNASGNEVTVEAVLLTPAPAGSLWAMDFSSTEALVPGSFRPERGTMVRATEGRILFRLSGGAGEALRFRLELR